VATALTLAMLTLARILAEQFAALFLTVIAPSSHRLSPRQTLRGS
jgi:hypothetical protein